MTGTRGSRIARIVASIAAGATLLGFTPVTAYADVPLHDYKEAVSTAALQVATGAYSQVAVNDPQYNRGEVLEVDGKPFWYNGIQIRIDKLRDDPAYGASDEALQSLFNTAAQDGFTVANSQIRWLDIQPNHESAAAKTAVIANGDNADKAIGQGATMTVNRKNAQGGQSLGLVQINTDGMTAEEIDGAALRLYNTSKQSKGRTIKVYGLANNDWNAETVTWNNAPVTVDDGGNVVESDTVRLASQTINATSDDSVKAVHYYDFYLGAWIKEQAKKNPGQTTFSFAIQDSSEGGDDIAFGGAGNDNAAYKPTLVYGDDTEFNYDVLDGAIDMAANAGLKFEMLWFGLDTCSTSMDQRVPVWALDETLHERTVTQDGKQLMWKQGAPGGVYGVYSYLMDKNDTELVSKEATAIKTALNHVATIKNAGTMVGVQLSNEPRIGAIHGSKKTDRSYSETSNKLFEKLGLSVSDFREYTMWTYNNTLGEAVKTSNHPVWTRVNLDEYADTEAVKYNEAKRADGGTNIDFIGIDHYRKTTTQLAQEGADDSQFANGSNLPMVMELGQKDNRSGGLYLEQDALATLSGGTYWTIYDASSSDGCEIYTFDKATGTFSPIDDVIPGLFKTNNMLKKIGTDLATNIPGSRGGNQLVFFNATSTAEGDFESAQVVGKDQDKAVTYKTADNGVGIAVNKGANELALLTNRAGTFTINNLPANKVTSAETGYYDANNQWHKTGEAQVSGDSAAVVTLNAYDVVRIVSQDGGYGKVEIPDEQILKIFEAEDQQYAASDGVKTEEWDDGASNGGWVKVNSAKAGDAVTFTIDVPADGEYQLSTRMLRANNRGRAQVSVDGKNLGDELDMYSASKGFTTLAATSNVELTKGSHTVTYTVTGKNDASSGYVLGIDYIQLKQKGLYKVGLRTLIEQATAIEKGNYTDDTWNALQTAIKNAQTAVDTAVNANAIASATEALQAAIDGLLENTDKTSDELQAELKALIAKADEELAKTDTYSAENLAALKAARDNAQNLLGDPAISPAQWAKEVRTLQTAIDTLKATAPAAATYYVSKSGKDTNSGLSEDSPWNLEKINATTFKPGDRILFKAGDVWEATGEANLDYDNPTALLHPLGSGDASAKITLGSYGSVDGSRPVFKGNAKVNDTVQLKDQEYWDISGLDVSNTAEGFTGNTGGAIDETNGALVGDFRGIHIYGQEKVTLTGFNLHDLYVHDVTGEISWITQSQIAKDFDKAKADMQKASNGVLMAGGWDFSKRTGGILVETFKPKGEPTIFSDIVVENNDLRQNSFGAFTIKQWYGGSNAYAWWDGRAENGYTSKARMHKNVTIRNNYIDQKGVYNGDGIYLTSVQGSLIEGNVVGYPGVCGIELYFADSVTVQNNEVFESQRKAGGGDSNAIDPDRNCTNIVIQYNYIHDNGDGILICGYDYNTVIIRYNVFFNNRAKILRDCIYGGTVDVYNNVFYQGSDIQKPITAGDSSTWVSASSNGEVWTLRNNIFYYEENSTGNNLSNHTMSAGWNVNYDHNVYYGFTPSTNDANATVLSSGDALFQGALKEHSYPTSLAERVSVFDALRLANAQVNDSGVPYEWNSKLIAADKIFGLGDSMSKDYNGVTLNATTPDPGILETDFTGAGGIIADAYGRAIAGVKVTFKGKNGKTYTATTNNAGFFQLPDIAPGDYAVTATDADGKTVATADAKVADAYTTVNLVTTAETGTLTGKVLDSKGNPVEGAAVTLTVSAKKQLTATTNAQGGYEFKDAPVSLADLKFTLTVTKDGFVDGSLKDVEVKANAATQTADVTLAKRVNFEFDVDGATTSNDGLTKRYGETNNAQFSGGKWTAFENGKVGSYAEYTFVVDADGEYDLNVFTKDRNNRATAQMSIDSANVGAPMVMGNASSDVRNSYAFRVALKAGEHKIRFTITNTDKGNLFGLDNMTITEHLTVADGLTTLSKEDFSAQTEPANYGFKQYATVGNGKLNVSGMGNYTSAATDLTGLKGKSKAGVRFLWSGVTSTNDNGNSKIGVQLKDDQGHLVFALTSAKGSEVRYSTTFKDGVDTVYDAQAATQANEPVWTTVNADPTKTYEVNVVADFDANTVTYTVTPVNGGVPIITGSASIKATSLDRLLLVNYWGTKTSQTLDDIELRVAESAPETKKFIVTFDANEGAFASGATTSTVEVEDGKPVSAPADAAAPVRDGYRLVGWTTDKDGKTDYDFTAAVKAALTLYAKWEKVEPEQKPADKAELRSAVDGARKLDPDDYTYPSWHGVDVALGAARIVLDDKDATQQQVDVALKALQDALGALVKRPSTGGGTTVITKKQVLITGVAAADAWFDGKAHVGFEGTPSSDFKGSYEVTYRGSGSTTYGPSKDAPTAAGTYRVTVSVPESDPTWYGSLALEFSIRSGSTVVGRFYTSGQGAQGLHMWTASDAESGALGASGWNREGDAFVMDAHAGDPVYRLYDPRGNQHLWTTSKDERDHLVGLQGWNDEGVAFYQNPAATVDVYRLYNPWTGEHLWTTSVLERDSLTALSDGAWSYEGVAFKAMAK